MRLTAEEVRGIRERLGLTQEGLALEVGVRAVTVSRWERGVTEPGREMVERLLGLEARGVEAR